MMETWVLRARIASQKLTLNNVRGSVSMHRRPTHQGRPFCGAAPLASQRDFRKRPTVRVAFGNNPGSCLHLARLEFIDDYGGHRARGMLL